MKRLLCILIAISFTGFLKAQNSLPVDSVNNINNSVYVSDLTPNPASSNIYFNYDLATPGIDASIKIYNPLGTLVKTVALNPSAKNAQVDISGLPEGFYFYSVIANGKAINTKRLIISR